MKRIRKTLSLALILSMATLLSVAPTPAYATPPTPVSGTFDYTFEVTGMRVADGNTFIYATEWEQWVGDFEGTAISVFRVEMFRSGFWNVWLESTFTGEAQGKSGTVDILVVGKKPEGQGWYGQWVILSGTGELANLHGRGIWWGPGFGNSPAIYYSGNIHFENS